MTAKSYPSPKRIKRYSVIIAVIWTVVLIAIYFIDITIDRKELINEARINAEAAFNKEIQYRRWNAMHGGVYVPVTAKTPPNPFLDVKNRDLTTQNGITLTLVNPAYMTRQVNELSYKAYGNLSHITSLNPIRPQNAPDPWEVNALKLFDQGVKEVSSEEIMDGRPYLRFMKPLITEKSCLKCHEKQGYLVGDIRGGISVSVPLKPYFTNHSRHVQFSAWLYAFIWLSGLGILFYVSNNIIRNNKIRKDVEVMRKNTEKQLIDQNYYLEKAQELGHIGTWELDMINNNLYWTDENCRIFGVPEGSIVEYEIFLDKVHPDDREYVDREWQASITGKPYDIEHRLLIDGNVKWVRNKADIKFDQEGRGIKAIGVTQDITERKLAEESLKKSEERHRTIIQTAMNGFWVIDIQGHILEVNDVYCKMSGFSREELLKMSVSDLEADESPEEIASNIRTIIEKGEHRFVRRQKRKDGNLFDIELSVKYQPEEKIMVCFLQDVTEQNRIVRELRESEEKYKILFDNAPLPYQSLDENGNFLEVNAKWLKSLGYQREEVIGKSFAEFLHPDWIEHFRENFPRFKSIGEVLGVEFELRHKDGTYIWVTFDGKVKRDDAGNFIQTHCVFSDITDRRKLEKDLRDKDSALRQAQKMESIGTLAGGIAHDFNNILSPIMLHAEMMMDDIPPDDPLQHDIREIYKAGKRAKDLVQQILTFARKKSEEKIVLRSSLVVKEVIKFLRSTIPTTIDIQYHIETDQDTVLADPTQLNQIVMNLCTNAAYAMKDKGGLLEVTLGNKELAAQKTDGIFSLKPGKYLKLSVRDSGTGISPEDMGRIFEPYFTTKGQGEGTGLGLAIIHGIIQSYGGDINVETKVGDGTTFNVFLPLVEGTSAVTDDLDEELPKGSESILVVDDEDAILTIISKMLTRLGYKVTARTGSMEILDIFSQDPEAYDLVLTDMTMPNMTGKELAGELRKLRSDIPIILCSGFNDQIDEQEAKKSGVNAFIMKPVARHEIAKTIRKILDKA